ncbi:MAG TPA: YbaK/EbsC family protein [Egibacteraceae bacterium]|nr:YbaK/EbsC family protein [Egibacteraceae bacterium]
MRELQSDDNHFDPVEQRVLDAVGALGVDVKIIRIDPSFASTAAFCERYGYSMDASANCIVVASKTGERTHAACCVQATRRLDVNKTVRKLIGARKVSFAPAEETVALTGMLPDGVTPFGLPPALPLYIDAGVMDFERVIVGGGSRMLKLEVPTEAFTRLPAAEIVPGLALPVP